MCGINGIYAYHYAANPADRRELRRTRDHMAPRGPDGAGEWIAADARIALGHRRLAVIDLTDAGAQPMASADGRFVVTFSGEIYNYRALRACLEAAGHVFRSRSDSEVLLSLYAEKGAAMVHELRGMFAFAIWDRDRRRLFLARDPHGIKPLYYADDGWTFRFASQVKALLAGGALSRDPEPAGWVGFHLWGSVPEPFTTFQAIRMLPAGTTLVVDSIGAHAPQSYHTIAAVYCAAEHEAYARPPAAIAEVEGKIHDALRDSVRHHLVADVGVGAFLSAGVDSGALIGLMCDAGLHDIQTVTLSFETLHGTVDDEAALAEEVARTYGVRHTARVVTERVFEADLPRILDAMDQPTIDGINTWFVAKAARELGLKVALSGLGGDELFGGYPAFRDIPRWVRWLGAPSRVPLLGRATRTIGQCIAPAMGLSPKAAGMLELGGTYPGAYILRRGLFMPWEMAHRLDRDMAEQGLRALAPLRRIEAALAPLPRSPHARVATLETALYMRNQLLRDTDWASMAHGLEVRVPLVDRVLLDAVAKGAAALARKRMPLDKDILARSPSTPLAAAVVGRSKTGFTPPMAQWLQAADSGREQTAPHGTGHWSREWAARLVAV